MLVKRLSFAFCLMMSLYCFKAQATAVNNELQQAMTLGSFEQKKFFKILKQPIKSSGQFYLDKTLGFYWQTQKPVNSAILFKSGELFEQNHHGEIKKIAGGGTLATVLIKAISGEMTALENDFSVMTLTERKCLVLKPKYDSLSQAINQIEICGGKQPSSIVLFEAKGNKTEIALTYHENAVIPEAVRAQLQ